MMNARSWLVRVALIGSLVLGMNEGPIAATFKVLCSTDQERVGGCSIAMQGKIEPGDDGRLIQALRSPQASSTFFRRLVLNSPGGDVREALKLSDIIVSTALDTTTFINALPEYRATENICVSACFLVWVAGAERSQASMGLFANKKQHGIGLHRPYFSPAQYAQLDAGTASQRQQELFARVRAYLRRFEVPDALIDEMMRRSSREVYWLSVLDDPFTLSGRAPWFEELMIAQCKFDPVYDREAQAQGVKEIAQNIKDSAVQKDWQRWRWAYNDCEYSFRKAVQRKFLAAK